MKADIFYRIAIFICVLFVAGVFFAADSFCLELKSSAFEDGEIIPTLYTAKGEDISPALSWSDVPGGTRSFVLIMDDPDAPVKSWVHWIVYNIPPDMRGFEENVPKKKVLDNGIKQGTNSWRMVSYGGPCPPPGKTHRYIFKLYAVNIQVDLPAGASRKEVSSAIEGHILEKAELTGLFKL